MGEKKTAVFGIYSSREEQSGQADALVNAGFTPADLSVLFPENLWQPSDRHGKSD